MGSGINPLFDGPMGPEPFDETSGLAPKFAVLSDRRKLGIVLAAALITSIEISSRLSINVILPDMQGNVAADVDQISWVLILYNMGFICSMALTPWMSRIFGARRHFTLCVLLYTCGTLGCFLSAHNLTTLLISRTIMGLGGGFFLVRLVIMVGLFYPGASRRVPLTKVYLILFSMQVFYPPVVGALADNIHWNYAFLLDVPFLIVGILILRKLLPRGHLTLQLPRRPQDEDLWGAAFLIFSLSALQIFASRGERDLWFESPVIWACLISAVGGFALFVWWDTRPENPAPVLHLRHVLHLAPLRRALMTAMVVGGILGAGLYVIPQYLRYVQDFSATQTGGFFSFFAFGFGAGAILTVRVFAPRFGVHETVMAGLLVLAATFTAFIYTWTPSTPTQLLDLLLLAKGVGVGMAVIGISASVTGRLSNVDVWEGDTTYFFVRQLGNTFAVSAVTILFDRRMTLHSSRLLDVANRLDPSTSAALSSYAGLTRRVAGAGFDPRLGALQLFQNNVITQSRLLSYIDISFFLALVCVAGVIFTVISKIRSSRTEPITPIAHL